MYVTIASKCPSPEEIERYSLEEVVEPNELASIEEHLLICDDCHERLLAADHAYTAIMRAALTQFDLLPVHIHAVHQMSEGSVYLWISEGDEGCCIARIQGCQVDSGHVVESVAAAVQQNNTSFGRLLPEHTCSSECTRYELPET